MKNEAQSYYEATVTDLHKYCENETDLTAVILDEEYPYRVQFVPNPQQTVFGNENVDENGEVNDLTVTVGLTTTVKSTLKFKMSSKQLKKLIKLAEKLGYLYYQAFREGQGERITRKRPTAMGAFRDCPGCGCDIVRPEYRPAFCQECGQALDWTPEPAEEQTVDEYAAGLEKLRELCGEKEAEV